MLKRTAKFFSEPVRFVLAFSVGVLLFGHSYDPKGMASEFLGVPMTWLYFARLSTVVLGSLCFLLVLLPYFVDKFSKTKAVLGIAVSKAYPGGLDFLECRVSLRAKPPLAGIPNPLPLRTVARWRDKDLSNRPFRLSDHPKVMPILWRDFQGLYVRTESGERHAFTCTDAKFLVFSECEHGKSYANIRIRLVDGFPMLEITHGTEADDIPITVQPVEHSSDLLVY
jgi:hypothetical protein